MIGETPKVSVCVVTYNHEKYIKKCLESIVTQKCDFDFEIIVGEDCSTDGTQVIIQEYTEKYPDIVKPVFHEKNLGPQDNYLHTHNMAQGKYIAHMDGDDYALPGKLQAQADFMDKTPDCNICFHRVKALFLDGTLKDDLIDYEKFKDGFERKDLLSIGSLGTHSSKMYRKELRELVIEYKDSELMDLFVNDIQIENKKAMYVSEQIYGVYRVGVGIIMNSKIIDIRLGNLKLLYNIFPAFRCNINTYAFILLLADLKNFRSTSLKHFKFWLKTFHIFSLFNFFRIYPLLKYFKIPK